MTAASGSPPDPEIPGSPPPPEVSRDRVARRLPSSPPPWRVFLSHTSEFRRFPSTGGSYIDKAERAVLGAGHGIGNMEHYRASDGDTGGFDERQVQASHVYVGIYGMRWGTPLPGQPDLSYTVQEFEAASAAGIPRLIFVLDEDDDSGDVRIPSRFLRDDDHGHRQQAFLQRIQSSGELIIKRFRGPDHLAGLVETSLRELEKQRGLSNEEDRVFASAKTGVRQSIQNATPLDCCSRLMILVRRAQANEQQALSDSRFMATTWLTQPSGDSGKPFDNDWKDSTSETTFKLEELAASIVGWYSDVSNFIVAAGNRAAHVLVCLILPAELLASASLHRLLRMIREQCQAEDGWDAEPPPPIVLACTERLEARVLSQDQFRLCGSQSQRRWRAADATALAISMEISECCGGPSGSLSNLSWSLYCDDHPVHGNGVGHPSPKGLMGENHCARPAGVLQERGKPLCSFDETCAHHKPQALYLSWHADIPKNQPDSYRLRILRILQSGVPMFLLDSPGLNPEFWYNGALSLQASDADYDDHPLDALLCWSYPELMRRISRYHKTFEAPATTSDAAAWSYLRHMIFFCDDHRYRPPAGSAFNVPFL